MLMFDILEHVSMCIDTPRHKNAFRTIDLLWGEFSGHDSSHKVPVMKNYEAFLLLAWASCCTKDWIIGDLRRVNAHLT